LRDLSQDGLGHTEGGLLQASHRLVKIDKADPVGMVQDRERTSDFETPALRFLSACAVVDHHRASSDFDCRVIA